MIKLSGPLLVSAIAVCGCTFLPTIQYDRQSLVQSSIATDSPPINQTDAALLAIAWRDRLGSAAESRHTRELATNEILYYGTLILTAAQYAIGTKGWANASNDVRHARNVGAGMVLGSTLFSEHYRSADQRPIFEKAYRKMSCATDLLSETDLVGRLLFEEAEFAALKSDSTPNAKSVSLLYDAIPRQVLDFVEHYSLAQVRTELQGVVPGALSRTQLTKMFDDLKRAEESAQDAADPKNGPNKNVLIDASTTHISTIKTNMALGRGQFIENSTKTDTTASVKSSGAAKQADRSQQKILEAQAVILMMASHERIERKRRFISAVVTFSTALDACRSTGS